MKYLILLLPLVLLSISSAEAKLLPIEARVLTEEIDNHCGDTWCEGEYDFNFKSVEQSDDELIVNFDVIIWASNLESFTPYPRECRIPGDYSFDDLLYPIHGSQPGDNQHYRLTDFLADQMNECISSIERELN